MGKIRRRPAPPEFIMRRVEGVPLHFLSDPADPNSALVEEKFTLELKSYTAYGFTKLQADHLDGKTFFGEEGVEAEIWSHSIVGIIDENNEALTEENGEPPELTATFFLSLVEEDRKAIREAIKKDANPSTSPQNSPAPGDSGPKAEASEA